MAHTTTETYTVERALDRCDPTDLPDALRTIILGKFIRSFVEEVTDTFASGEHDDAEAALTGTPIPGSIRVSVDSGGTITNKVEQPVGGTVVAQSYKVTAASGTTTVTLKDTTEVPDAADITISYLQIGGNNANDTPLALADLTALFQKGE